LCGVPGLVRPARAVVPPVPVVVGAIPARPVLSLWP
jgi:hypothetical protein